MHVILLGRCFGYVDDLAAMLVYEGVIEYSKAHNISVTISIHVVKEPSMLYEWSSKNCKFIIDGKRVRVISGSGISGRGCA